MLLLMVPEPIGDTNVVSVYRFSVNCASACMLLVTVVVHVVDV